MIKLLCLFPIIIIIIFIILFQVFKLYYFETFENLQINPIIQTAKEVSYLETLKKENEEIRKNTDNLRREIKDMEIKLNKLELETKNKENEKINLESKISDIKKEREINLTIAELVKQSINKTLEKEDELKLYEQNLNKQKEENIEFEKIKENQKLNDILNKLEQVKINTNDINKNTNFCDITTDMPKPIFKIYNENEQDLLLKWCKCDKNINNNECINYNICKNNYNQFKDNTSLGGEDLLFYFNCLKLYPEFPKYLSDNNSKKI